MNDVILINPEKNAQSWSFWMNKRKRWLESARAWELNAGWHMKAGRLDRAYACAERVSYCLKKSANALRIARGYAPHF